MKFELRSVVLPLVIINIIIFILQIFVKDFTDAFILVGSDVFSRPWILLTSMFLHGGVYHLLVNMYALLMFGGILEQKIGPKRFLLLYLASGLIAAFLSAFFYARALGASGAIYGIIGGLIILMPNLPLLFLFFVPMPLWVAGIIYVMIDVFGVIFPSGTGNIAHLVGVAVGLLYGLHLKGQSEKFKKKFSAKRHLDEVDIDEYLKSGRI